MVVKTRACTAVKYTRQAISGSRRPSVLRLSADVTMEGRLWEESDVGGER
jgi:hypothetical protein